MLRQTQQFSRRHLDQREHLVALGDQLMIDGWLDRAERARFWCAFRITRPQDNTLIAECRQLLALIEMPTGKLLRLPVHWKTYDKVESSERSEHESRAGTVPGGEHVQ